MPDSTAPSQDERDQQHQAVAVDDVVITWYDDDPVRYGGDSDGAFTELSFGLCSGRLPVRKCAPDRVAPASVTIPGSDPRVEVAKLRPAEVPPGAEGPWRLTLPGQRPSWHRLKRDGTAAGLRRLAILDWHAARAAQPAAE